MVHSWFIVVQKNENRYCYYQIASDHICVSMYLLRLFITTRYIYNSSYNLYINGYSNGIYLNTFSNMYCYHVNNYPLIGTMLQWGGYFQYNMIFKINKSHAFAMYHNIINNYTFKTRDKYMSYIQHPVTKEISLANSARFNDRISMYINKYINSC